MNMDDIFEEANKIFLENFPSETHFERAIFFSWHCNIRDCAYCYMSTQPKVSRTGNIARRSSESLIAELIICKKMGWEIGFISGGVGAFNKDDFRKLLEQMHSATGDKFWINVGALDKETLKDYLPYIKGVVGSIETVNEKLHRKVCPSKPEEPYYMMFEYAKELGLKNAITIIVGLGETIDDFDSLKNIIRKYDISKIHIYGLNPHKGTVYENSPAPTKEYQAEWIAKTRIEFPKLDIQFGIWEDRPEYTSFLLKAGANSISKYPALKEFNSDSAKEIEMQAKLAGRKFIGTLTKMPNIDWDSEVDKLNLEKSIKEKIKAKIRQYVLQMNRN
jgi:biotin synthase-like enzyme